MDLGIIDKIECSHIIQTGNVVGVAVGEQYGVDVSHPFAQHLLAEVGAGVDDYAHSIHLYHRRGAESLVASIVRAADLASAPDNGYALRGSCA